jgi:hypothetical protein
MELLMTRETMRSAKIGPKTGPTIERWSTLATIRETPKPASLQGFSEWS